MSNRPDGALYVGVTADLVRRVFQHREGTGSAFVRRYGLTRLVYFERYEAILTAIAREKAIKGWNRAWKVRLITRENAAWDDLFAGIV
jgi:putative endonuclease